MKKQLTESDVKKFRKLVNAAMRKLGLVFVQGPDGAPAPEPFYNLGETNGQKRCVVNMGIAKL